ncbi:hypothetical protein J6497_28270 [Bradyrhizobium sp. CNPSo 4026]|nr:hypothetical protein [Bradyrhizobium cenepequi]
MDSPMVVLLPAGPPACELPPALLPVCAIATADDNTKTAAKLIVLILIVSLTELLPIAPTGVTMIRSHRQLQLERKVATSNLSAFRIGVI